MLRTHDDMLGKTLKLDLHNVQQVYKNKTYYTHIATYTLYSYLPTHSCLRALQFILPLEVIFRMPSFIGCCEQCLADKAV